MPSCAAATGRVLAHREHRGRQHGGLGEPVGERGGEERHRHGQVSRHHRHVRGDGPYARLRHQRDADISIGHQRRRAHALGRFAHRDAVQHRVERAPALEPDQPRHIRPEDRRPPPASASAAPPSGTRRYRGTRTRCGAAAPRSRPAGRSPGRRRRSGPRPGLPCRPGARRRCRPPPPIARRRRGRRSAPSAGA